MNKVSQDSVVAFVKAVGPFSPEWIRVERFLLDKAITTAPRVCLLILRFTMMSLEIPSRAANMMRQKRDHRTMPVYLI